ASRGLWPRKAVMCPYIFVAKSRIGRMRGRRDGARATGSARPGVAGDSGFGGAVAVGGRGGGDGLDRLLAGTAALPRGDSPAGGVGQAGDEGRAAQRPLAGHGLVDALALLARQPFLQAAAVIGLAVERRIAAGPVIGVVGLP